MKKSPEHTEKDAAIERGRKAFFLGELEKMAGEKHAVLLELARDCSSSQLEKIFRGYSQAAKVFTSARAAKDQGYYPCAVQRDGRKAGGFIVTSKRVQVVNKKK